MLGISEEVVAYFEDLSYGPIETLEFKSRARWIEARLGYEWADEWLEAKDDAFWSMAASTEIIPVAWVNRHSAAEYAGFLAFVTRMGSRPFLVVDVTDVEIALGKVLSPTPTFGVFNPSQIVSEALVARAAPLSASDLDSYVETWKQLQRDNAELRIVDSDRRLTSAAFSYFDEVLLSHISEEWKKCTLVVGESLQQLTGNCRWVGDLLLWARLRDIVESGQAEAEAEAEAEGDMLVMHLSRVRLPTIAANSACESSE